MSIAGRLRGTVRRALRSRGYEIVPWPGDQPGPRRQRVIATQRVGSVLDVGANEGQYARDLRRWGYTGRIVSFEPLAAPFAQLRRYSAGDARWEVHQLALGRDNRRAVMNVAANGGASSSILPMLANHERAAPDTAYIGTEEIAQRSLDSVVSLAPGERVLLKIDVQGFEKEVLAGATAVLAHTVALELELSFVPLYAGGPLFGEMMQLATDAGFTLMELVPVFRDHASGALLQADGLFARLDR